MLKDKKRRLSETFERECSFVCNNAGREMHSLRNEQQFDPRQKHESLPQGGRTWLGIKVGGVQGWSVRSTSYEFSLSLSLFEVHTGFVDENGFRA